MKRPLMGMGIALVAGAAAVWTGMSAVCVCFAAAALLLYLKLRTGGSRKYILGLSVFFVVGFCRALIADRTVIPLSGEIQGQIYRIQEKEKCRYLFIRSGGTQVLVVETGIGWKEERFYKGQVLRVCGEAEYFEPPGNPGQFDEKNYYKSQGISYRIWAEKTELIAEGGWLFRRLRMLERLRMALCDFYIEEMGDSGAGVLCAAVLGERSGFQGDLRRYYQENGWLHLVTVSGLHLSFIAMGFYRRLRRWGFPLPVSMFMAVALMLAYGYMTDLGDSMLRAMGMMALVLTGELLGRKTDLMTSLLFTGGLMVLFRPERLLSAGFLLSFGAVGGMAFGEWLWQLFRKKEKNPGIKSRCLHGCYIQSGIFLVTTPLVLWNMYEIPVIGSFYNFFMIPLVSLLVPAAFGAGMAGVCGLPLLSELAGAFLKVADWILMLVHKLPSMTWICGRPEGWQMGMYILCILGWAFLRSRKTKIFGKMSLVAGCFILLILRFPEDRIICMDVGQGDGICIITAAGQMVFVDGGSSDVDGIFQYRLEPLMKYYGLRKIDAWLLTHGDRDHISGIEEALEGGRTEICKILLPDTEGDKVLENIQELAESRKIEVERIFRGNRFSAGDFSFECLHPEAGNASGDRNNESLVLSVKRKNSFCMLLMGDAEAEGEAEMLKLGGLPVCDLLKAGHHGAGGASTGEFLSIVRPRWTLISCGENNRYGHPSKETLKRLEAAGSQWVTTVRYGALTVTFDGEDYLLKGYKNRD